MNDYLSLLSTKPMTLIMSLPQNDPDLCRAAFEAGADVVKIHINVGHRASGNRFGSLHEQRDVLERMLAEKQGPMGIVPGGSLEDALSDLDAVCALPFSFLSLYAHHTPVQALHGGLPLMIAPDYSYSLDEIAELSHCGASVLEASIIPGEEYGSRLSLRDLLKYSAIARRTALPMVVPTQRFITPDDVPALMNAGARALMIGAVVTGKERAGIVKAITAFRRAIEEAS